MASTTLPGVLLTGDHASRPAASAVGKGALYACSTHSLIYQSDGSSWSTWATLGSTETLPATIIDAKGDLIVGSAADTAARLAVGTDGQVLTADAASTNGVKWAASGASTLTTKGDLLTYDTGAARLAVGTDGQVLTADSAQAKGVKWATPSSGTSIPEQSVPYPTSASGDDDLSASTAGWSDVGANAYTTFSSDGKVITCIVTGASKTSAIRKTLGTTKAGVFDFRLGILPYSDFWSSATDTPVTVYFKTSGGSQIAAMRFYAQNPASPQQRGFLLAVAGSGAFTTSASTSIPLGMPVTLRCKRDGSDSVTFEMALGSTPFALLPVVEPGSGTYRRPLAFTSSGTVARVEIENQSPSGPASSAEWGFKLDYFQSA